MADQIAGVENAGVENDGPIWEVVYCAFNCKMQDWKMADQIAGVENAGAENDGPIWEVVYCALNCIASMVTQLL